MNKVLAFPFRGMVDCVSPTDTQEPRVRYEHLTVERVHELLNYSPDTGDITWKIRPAKNSRKRAGDLAGTVQSAGFRVIYLDGKLCQATQIAFLFANGRWAVGQVGVKNNDPLDLRADNLREMRTTSRKHDFSTPEGKRAYSLDYWHTNADYRRDIGWRRYYWITRQQYEEMYAAQNGVCAICSQPETSKQGVKIKYLSVDHCHATGMIRGLLCTKCNSGLGQFDDSLERLEKAFHYRRDAKTEFFVPVGTKIPPVTIHSRDIDDISGPASPAPMKRTA